MSDLYKAFNKNIKKYIYKIYKKFDQYIIYNVNDFYQDMNKYISSNEKIIIVIYPEGICERKFSVKNYDINQENINNFNIIENKCFNYKKGAFVLSLMNSIPVIQTISYSPMPNYNYNYFDKNYSIKHINHLGIKILKPYYKHLPINELSNSMRQVASQSEDYIQENSESIENYRQTMETKFRKRYIETLLSAHKFNIAHN
jgi:hypothetical protein